MASARSGIGTAITFATSGFTAQVRNYNDIGIERQILDATHMGSAAGTQFTNLIFRETCPGDLGTVKELNVDIIWNPDEVTLPIDQDSEVITLQFKAQGTQTTGAQWIINGYISDFSGAVPYDDIVTGTITIATNGEPTWNAGV